MTMSSDSETDSFAVGEDFVQSPTHQVAVTSHVDFDGLLDTPLVLHQDLRNGNGGQLWPAGMILTKYLLRKKRDELRQASMFVLHGSFWHFRSLNRANGRTCSIELGAGVGFCGYVTLVTANRDT